jgi:methylated-DNA-protein-cysteine methyltransferase-like protein
VATYGQVASLAGLAGQARRVGRALRILGESAGVPWHRVVNAQGRISLTRVDPGSAAIQRLRLLDEGVRFDRNGRVDLEACRWRP